MQDILMAATVMAVLLAGPVAAQDSAQDAAQHDELAKKAKDKHAAKVAREVAESWAEAPVEEQAVTTRHTISAGGNTIDYRARAGTLTIRNKKGKPEASVFYVAYLAGDGEDDEAQDRSGRPLTFFFNGGPGSASLWLHMGSFAPMRVKTGSPVSIGPPPYEFGPNPYNLLGVTDMVFIDMVGAGYSRMLGAAKGEDFWGVDQDVDAFARSIMRYVTKFDRWNSPKLIFGESYGTTRAGALAYQLQERGMALNGVILLSSVLNYGIDQSGFDRYFIAMLPSYSAAAWYHKQVPNRPDKVADFVQEAREFAYGPYAEVLSKGNSASQQEIDRVAARMSDLTGLSEDYIEESDLRVDLSGFRKELLRDERLTIGRFDSRYTGIDPDASGAEPRFDASSTAITGAFVASVRDHLGTTLKYESPLHYRLSARAVEEFDWDWEHTAPGREWPESTPNTAVDLGAAMRTNPYLKVLSLNGYYDMATPFFQTEYDLSHLDIEADRVEDVYLKYYPSGHMIYLNPDALAMMHDDLVDFYEVAAP
ncbi:MAG TPA: hypothetical protein VFG91_04755 [Woeseiaceae bacterium]|nr:hypothetical protein [Woeseiaceae bacterium]